MNFIAPFFLWLSIAISVPIIIHIFSRLKFKTVEFSSIRFIQQLESTSIRKVKIQELTSAGATVVKTPTEIGEAMKEAINGWKS